MKPQAPVRRVHVAPSLHHGFSCLPASLIAVSKPWAPKKNLKPFSSAKPFAHTQAEVKDGCGLGLSCSVVDFTYMGHEGGRGGRGGDCD